MNREQLIVVSNPEDLLVDSGDLEALAKLDAKRLAVSQLAGTLAELSAASLASLVRKLEHEGSTLAINEYLVETLRKKVFEATPDQLSAIIEEAKQLRVWYRGYGLKEAVLDRNKELAEQVAAYTNIEALAEALRQMAKGDGEDGGAGWLPRPVYDAAKEAMLNMIPEADMATLNKIGDLASDWRMRGRGPGSLQQAIVERDHEIMSEAGLGYDKYKKGSRFVVKNDTRTKLIEGRHRVLGMLSRGYTLEKVIV